MNDIAIRFSPIDPNDASPALYLSDDNAYANGPAILTSVVDDLAQGVVPSVINTSWVRARCERERLYARIVTMDEAIRDLTTE